MSTANVSACDGSSSDGPRSSGDALLNDHMIIQECCDSRTHTMMDEHRSTDVFPLSSKVPCSMAQLALISIFCCVGISDTLADKPRPSIMNTLRPHYLCLFLLCACTASTPPPQTPASNAPPPSDDSVHQAGDVGTQLVRDVTESPEKFEISKAESGGLGGYAIRLDGKPLWPPTGEGCDKFVACCTSLAAIANPLALSCLLAIGRDKTCSAAFATSTAIATEESYPLPASCTR